MALIERYANAWHMLIERQYLICINYVYWSGVQVSNWCYGYLGVRDNKYLILTTYDGIINFESRQKPPPRTTLFKG